MARRRGGRGGGGGGYVAQNQNPMYGLVAMAIGVLVMIVTFMIVPVIGANVQEAMPAITVGSDWDAGNNTDLPDTAEMWGTLSGFLYLTAIVMILAGLLQVLMSIGILRIRTG